MDSAFYIELIGIAGQVLFIGAYFLLQFDKIEEEGKLYGLMNLTAAILAVIYYGSFYAYAGVLGNLIWGVIAIFGLYNAFKNKERWK